MQMLSRKVYEFSKYLKKKNSFEEIFLDQIELSCENCIWNVIEMYLNFPKKISQ